MITHYRTRQFLPRVKYIVAIILVVASSLSSLDVFAEARYDQKFFAKNNILVYNPRDTCTVGGASSELSGADNEEKIWNWLIGNGLKPEQAAGIMGNMSSESGLNPFRFQGGATTTGVLSYDGDIPGYNQQAWGLVQWDGPRRIDESGTGGVIGQLLTAHPDYKQYIDPTYGATADSYSNAPSEIVNAFLKFELEYMLAEASPGGNRSTVWGDIKNTTTVLDATVLFHNDFEGSADSAEQVKSGARSCRTSYL